MLPSRASSGPFIVPCFAVLLGLSYAACGGDTSNEGSTDERDTLRDDDARDQNRDADSDAARPTDGGAAADGGDARTDVGADPDARIDAALPNDAGGPSPQRLSGGVTLFEVRAPGIDALNVGGIAAGFTEYRAPEAALVITTVGPCNITAVAPGDSLFPDEATLDAGPIDVVTPSERFELAVTATDDGPRYQAAGTEGRSEFFEGGQDVTVAAAGGVDVPAFTGSIVTPFDPAITEPAWTFGSTSPRDEDLAVRWSGTTTGGDVIINVLPVTVFPEPGVAEGNSITCTVPDNGSMVIPAAALDYLPPAGLIGGSTVALTVVRAVTTDTTAVDLVVNATASHTIIGGVD